MGKNIQKTWREKKKSIEQDTIDDESFTIFPDGKKCRHVLYWSEKPRILFLSELGHMEKVPRNYKHMRTEFAQMCSLEADHCPIYQIDNRLVHHRQHKIEDYDHIILLISKSKDLRDFLLNFDG